MRAHACQWNLLQGRGGHHLDGDGPNGWVAPSVCGGLALPGLPVPSSAGCCWHSSGTDRARTGRPRRVGVLAGCTALSLCILHESGLLALLWHGPAAAPPGQPAASPWQQGGARNYLALFGLTAPDKPKHGPVQMNGEAMTPVPEPVPDPQVPTPLPPPRRGLEKLCPLPLTLREEPRPFMDESGGDGGIRTRPRGPLFASIANPDWDAFRATCLG